MPGATGSAPHVPGSVPGSPGAPAGTVPTPAREPAPTPAPPRRKERDPFFDNAKFLAILLVVIGHALTYRLDMPVAKGLYMFIYMFHMPLFIVVTGYFSRNWTFSGGKARKLITHVGVPYVIFEIAYTLYGWLAGDDELKVSLLNPYWLTWFLCALFFWRLSTPVWQQIRWPLAVSLAFALLSYMSDLGGTLDIHRLIGLLPFYVLGLVLKPEHFELLKKPIAPVLGWITLGAGLALMYPAMAHFSRDWVYWKHPHDELAVGNVTGSVMRLAMFAAAIVLVAAFMAVVPKRRTWFTRLGPATLYTYLLHGFVIRLLDYTGVWDAEWLDTIPGLIMVIAGSAVVGTFLCSDPVVRCMSWALEPKMTWAFTPLRRPGPKPSKSSKSSKSKAAKGAEQGRRGERGESGEQRPRAGV